MYEIQLSLIPHLSRALWIKYPYALLLELIQLISFKDINVMETIIFIAELWYFMPIYQYIQTFLENFNGDVKNNNLLLYIVYLELNYLIYYRSL